MEIQSSATILSSILSLYLLTDPPSPPSALPSVVSLIAEHKPLVHIESNSQALHKWNTRLSSLLQSKSAESRYWGICLAKATLKNGGEGITHAITWTKLLLAILNVTPSSIPSEIPAARRRRHSRRRHFRIDRFVPTNTNPARLIQRLEWVVTCILHFTAQFEHATRPSADDIHNITCFDTRQCNHLPTKSFPRHPACLLSHRRK